MRSSCSSVLAAGILLALCWDGLCFASDPTTKVPKTAQDAIRRIALPCSSQVTFRAVKAVLEGAQFELLKCQPDSGVIVTEYHDLARTPFSLGDDQEVLRPSLQGKFTAVVSPYYYHGSGTELTLYVDLRYRPLGVEWRAFPMSYGQMMDAYDAWFGLVLGALNLPVERLRDFRAPFILELYRGPMGE